MRGRCLAFLPLLMACGSDPVIFVPTPPEDPAALTVVVALDFDDGVAAKVYQQPLANPDIVSLANAFTGRPRVYALYYHRAPETLEFQLGELQAAGQGSLPCERGLPFKILSIQTSADAQDNWSPAQAPDRVLAHLVGVDACRPTDICKTWRPTSHNLESPSNVQIILPLSDDSVLAAGIDGLFHEARLSGVVRRPEFDGMPSLSLHQDKGGTLWFGGRLGRTAHGPFGGPFVEERLPTDINVGAIAPSPSGDRVLAVASKDDSTGDKVEVYLRDAGQWALIHEFDPIDASTSQSNVFWVDERTAVFNHGGRRVLRLNDRLVTDLQIPEDFKTIGYSPESGLWGGGRGGVVFHSDAPFLEFDRVPNSELGSTVDAVTVFEQGVLIGGAGGAVRQVIPGFAACESQRLASSDAEVIVPLGDMLVVSGGNPDQRFPNTITFLELLD